MQRLFYYLFAILFFFIPLILWPYTSEVFEFNKMVFVYIMTTVIAATWVIRMIIEKKFIFRPSLLDLPLVGYLVISLLSTLVSIDPHTSIFGYYSRFNGGFLSIICYGLLYWAFVSNMDRKSTLSTLYYVLYSAIAVSAYGILQHFGIDKNIWVQDVQNRVFSTLGQPNWLAAYLVALIPLIYNSKFSTYNYGLAILFFVTLLFTKSRSGLLGFIIADLIYWTLIFLKQKKQFLKQFFIFNFSFLILFLAIGNPYIGKTPTPVGPALESGGTESGVIRKIVWKGAIEIWRHYPILGTGPETFAYSYYQFRPVEHNLVSEWDFIYNKAHNEYLNIMANTGTFGILSYLILIALSIVQISKFTIYNLQFTKNYKFYIINYSLLSGYVGLLVSNFFGFSVVPTQLLLFLFPAIALSLEQESKRVEVYKIKNYQKALLVFSCSLALILLHSIGKYWYSDTLYAQRTEQSLIKAIKISPNEPLYHIRLAEIYSNLNDPQKAIIHSQKAIELSPANVNLRRSEFVIYLKLSSLDPKYLFKALDVIKQAAIMAPTDAKLFYNLGLTYVRLGQVDKAIEVLEKTVDLKPNYKEARLAYAFLLIDRKETKKAKEQLNYILEKIDPNDEMTKQTLESIK